VVAKPPTLNGQRHDQLDEWFVGRDLGFKYLKGHTMIVVPVDGLAPESIAQLLQSSRHGFYKGDVWDACTAALWQEIGNRMIQQWEQGVAHSLKAA